MNHSDSLKPDLKIIRLSSNDAQKDTDQLSILEELILTNEAMYPGIDKWFSAKVVPGILTKERTALVGYQGEKPIVSAVVKKGLDTKFCHLKIHEDFRDNHLGEVFFALMALEVRHLAEGIHFTLPSSLWGQKTEFFKSFGFKDAVKAGHQYRIFDDELRCSAAFETVWQAVVEKLPKLRQNFTIDGRSMDDDLVMSVKPQYADSIIRGDKKVEVRRIFSKKWEGSRVSLYVSSPVRALVGSATIARVVESEPEELWDNYNGALGCSKQEYDSYVDSAKEVFAIELEDVHPFIARVPISQISNFITEDLKPPQSYFNLKKNSSWAQAVSIATLLHGTTESRVKVI